VVKTLGDGVMVHLVDPAAAVRLGVRLSEDLGRRDGLPPLRVGIHTGPAVERGGDWFGAAVNVASRVAELASVGEVLVTEPAVQAAGVLPGVAFEDHGERRLKNVSGPVRVYAAAAPRPEAAGVLARGPQLRPAEGAGSSLAAAGSAA